jgi:thermitase
MKGIILSLALTLSMGAFAKKQSIDPTRLMVKTNDLQSISAYKYKKLFANWYVIQTQNAPKLQQKLVKDARIELTQLNYRSQKAQMPKELDIPYKMQYPMFLNLYFNDPQVTRVWSFADASQNGVSVHKSYDAPINRTASEIIVAVVDTGVDYNHEDLKDVMWINAGEIAGNGIDDDNNGYIDDVHGINTLVRDSNGNATGNPAASHAHGTHVAGTIAATQNNGTGIAGIASNARIMAIRTVPDSSDETDVDVVESFIYAAKHGAKLINCSFGKRVNEGGNIVNETITHIGKTYGTLTVAAAGNDSGWFGKHDIDKNPKYPASFDSDYLMVIASTASNGKLSSFSNVGLKSVDVAAPGSNIYSTTPRNRYGNMSGTSMATPTTVGVLAEVWSHFPNFGPLEIKNAVMNSVTKIGSFKKYMASGGRADLFNGLRTALQMEGNQSQQQETK